jgi:hypothetical protein
VRCLARWLEVIGEPATAIHVGTVMLTLCTVPAPDGVKQSQPFVVRRTKFPLPHGVGGLTCANAIMAVGTGGARARTASRFTGEALCGTIQVSVTVTSAV